MKERYYLQEWREVTKEEFVAAERRGGFNNTMGQPEEPATAGFGYGSTKDFSEVHGRVRHEA